MSTESTFHNHDTDLADGRLHSLPCPSPEHEGEPGNHDLLVRFAANVTVTGAASGVWLLRCWTGLCSYDSIAESLGIDLPRVRDSVARLLPYLAAAHDNDEDGQARLAFHCSWAELHPGQPDRCGWPGCEEPIDWGHTHEGARGTVQGTHVALWGTTDTDETALVVVGDVEAAALLYRAGLHSLYTPVTWYEARADYPQGSISDCDWSAVSGREVVIWLDEDAVASGRLGLVANRIIEAGAASLHVVDSRAPIGDDATEALIALESRRPFGAGDVSPGSGAAREETGEVHGEPEPDEPVTPGEQIDGVHGEPEPDEPAATAELLSTRPEFATDIGLALRFMADHGDGLVGASDPAGRVDASIYRTTAAGPLDPVGDDEVAVLMLRSQGRYLAEAGRESPAGLSPVQLAHARLMGSERAPGLVRRNLRAAFLALQDRGAAPAGYRQVSIADIDGDTRYLGAPNGVVDLSSRRPAHRPGSLLCSGVPQAAGPVRSRREARGCRCPVCRHLPGGPGRAGGRARSGPAGDSGRPRAPGGRWRAGWGRSPACRGACGPGSGPCDCAARGSAHRLQPRLLPCVSEQPGRAPSARGSGRCHRRWDRHRCGHEPHDFGCHPQPDVPGAAGGGSARPDRVPGRQLRPVGVWRGD